MRPRRASHPIGLGALGWLLWTGLAGGQTLLPPPEGQIYHAAFPDFGGCEDEVLPCRIETFEALAGKEIAWAYFSNNWTQGIEFPAEEVRKIHAAGRVPFIRMMPRQHSDDITGGKDCDELQPASLDEEDNPYPLESFLTGGGHEEDLRAWAKAAQEEKDPLLVEFGTEVNGCWFPWNALWNGGSQKDGYGDPTVFDGQERFRDTYRRIVDIFREAGAHNVTWFFHADCASDPAEPWNSIRGYYPGDEYVDWIGISCYGAQEPGEDWEQLTERLDAAYPTFECLSADKPMALLETAVTENSEKSKAGWIEAALAALAEGRYPRIRALSWWHENFDNSQLRIDSSCEALSAYREAISRPVFVHEPRFPEPPDSSP